MCKTQTKLRNAKPRKALAVNSLCLAGACSSYVSIPVKFCASYYSLKSMSPFHKCVGKARTIYRWCVYGIFGREITEYTVYGHKRYIYTVLANPTNVGDQEICKALRIDVFNKSQSTPECSKPTKPCKLCTCKLAGLAKPKYLHLNSTVYLGNK